MKVKYIFFSGLLALSALSCSDSGLYQSPSTSLTDENALDTYDGAKAVLTGAYASTEHYYYLTIGQISQEVMGNDLMISNGNFGYSTYKWLMYAYDYTQYPIVVDGWWSAYSPYLWEKAYAAITACNKLIEAFEAGTLSADIEDLVAQAYGLRGWNFLNLYHLFCPAYNNPTLGGDEGKGLFLRLSSASADEATMVERSNLKDSFEQIISDLTYAYKHVAATHEGTVNNPYYINPRACALLLARAYLELNDYTNASKYAEEAAGNTFDGSNLMSQAEYQSGFLSANSEWLLGMNFNSETTNIYASIPSFYHVADAMDGNSGWGTANYGTQVPGSSVAERYEYLTTNGVNYLVGYGTVRVAASFVGTFAKDDNGIFTDCRALFPFYISEDDGYFTCKFSNNGQLGVADYPLARIAEAYLIEAEAKLQTDAGKSLSILNALQAARGGSLSTVANIDEIYKERRRELYGEGFALGDLKRLCKGVNRVGSDHWSSVKTLDANSARMMFPIPDAELNYNPHYKGSNADYNEGQNDYWVK